MLSLAKNRQTSWLQFWTRSLAALLTRSTKWSEISWAATLEWTWISRKSESSDRWRFSSSGSRTRRSLEDIASMDVTACQKEVTISRREDMESRRTRLTRPALISSNATGKFLKNYHSVFKTLLWRVFFEKLMKMPRFWIRRNEAGKNLGWRWCGQMLWRIAWVKYQFGIQV